MVTDPLTLKHTHTHPPTHPHTHPQTGPITIHCATASMQCNEEDKDEDEISLAQN